MGDFAMVLAPRGAHKSTKPTIPLNIEECKGLSGIGGLG
jgi:hypothetical protein